MGAHAVQRRSDFALPEGAQLVTAGARPDEQILSFRRVPGLLNLRCEGSNDVVLRLPAGLSVSRSAAAWRATWRFGWVRSPRRWRVRGWRR